MKHSKVKSKNRPSRTSQQPCHPTNQSCNNLCNQNIQPQRCYPSTLEQQYQHASLIPCPKTKKKKFMCKSKDKTKIDQCCCGGEMHDKCYCRVKGGFDIYTGNGSEDEDTKYVLKELSKSEQTLKKLAQDTILIP